MYADARNVAVHDTTATRVQVYSGAWHGDRRVELDFPPYWKVQVVGAEPVPALDVDELQARLRSPLGTPPLAELARGRTSAAIIIDDISRPTPTDELLPLVLAELEQAGLAADRIRIVIAAGGHEPAAMAEHLKKVGAATADRIRFEVHDPDGDLVRAGTSPAGIPLHVNRTVMQADLKIGIGSVAPHDTAGMSGGSKILVPGVAGTRTARYVHDLLAGARHRGDGGDNAFRRELDIIAGMLGLDFIVNVVLGGDRRPIALFAGDRILAHREAARRAAEVFAVETVADADIVVANTYPYDGDLWFVPWGLWPLLAAPKGATKVAIADGSRGPGGHRLKPQVSFPERAWARLLTLRPRHVPRQLRHLAGSLRRTRSRQTLEFLMLCPHVSSQQLATRFPAAVHFHTWDSLLDELKRRHGDTPVKVAVYPCAPLQVPTARGDVP